MQPRARDRVIVKHYEQVSGYLQKLLSYHLINEKYNVAFSCCIFKIHGAGVENQLLDVQFLS